MTKKIIISFGEYLRGLREKDNLPLRKIAAELDIDPSLLAKIERGERYPTRDLIKQISKVFLQDEHKLVIEFLSDRIAYQLLDEADGMEALKVAEQKVKYFKENGRKTKPPAN